jgi:hypothetical protein
LTNRIYIKKLILKIMNITCNWCGKEVARPNTYSGVPQGWVWNKSFGFGRKIFCSNKCLSEYNAQNN